MGRRWGKGRRRRLIDRVSWGKDKEIGGLTKEGRGEKGMKEEEEKIGYRKNEIGMRNGNS